MSADNEIRQILINLIERTQTEDPMVFQLIESWPEYKFYLEKQESLEAIIKVFKKSAKYLFKQYCKEVSLGDSDVNKLLTYRQMTEAVAFYKNELNTTTEMISEYDTYLAHGHFFQAWLGGERDSEDLVDYREKVLEKWNTSIL